MAGYLADYLVVMWAKLESMMVGSKVGQKVVLKAPWMAVVMV